MTHEPTPPTGQVSEAQTKDGGLPPEPNYIAALRLTAGLVQPWREILDYIDALRSLSAPHKAGDALRMPEAKRYNQMGSAMVECFNTFDGKPSGAWVTSEDYDQALSDLQRAREHAKQQREADTNTIDLLADQVRQLQSSLLQAEEDTIERCARVCSDFSLKKWHEFKRGDGEGRANPIWEGQSDGAEQCAQAIRALGSVRSPEPSLLNSERGGGGVEKGD